MFLLLQLLQPLDRLAGTLNELAVPAADLVSCPVEGSARIRADAVFVGHVAQRLPDQTHQRLRKRGLLRHPGLLSIPPRLVEEAPCLSRWRL